MYHSSEVLLFLDEKFNFTKIDLLDSSILTFYSIIALTFIVFIQEIRKRRRKARSGSRKSTEKMRTIIDHYKKEVLSMHTQSLHNSFSTENLNMKSSLGNELSMESARDKNNERSNYAKTLKTLSANELKVTLKRKPRSFIRRFGKF